MELNIRLEEYFSEENLNILKKKAITDSKPLELVIFEFCDFLMNQRILSGVVHEYMSGNECPDIKHLAHNDKVRFIKFRKKQRDELM